jgi:hypothetical protein
MPPRPPIVTAFSFANVARGSVVSGRAGHYATGSGTATAAVTGAGAADFAVLGIETFDVVPVIDPPPGHPPLFELQPALKVAGAGPIDVTAAQAVMFDVSFACPMTASEHEITAVVSLGPNALGVNVPARAIVDLGNVALSCTASRDIAPGTSETFQFELVSTLADPVSVEVSLNTLDEPSYSMAAQTMTLPGGFPNPASRTFSAEVRCDAAAAPGVHNLPFVLKAADHSRLFTGTSVQVRVQRLVDVRINLTSPTDLFVGTSVELNVFATANPGPARFSVAPGPLPGFLTITDGHGNVGGSMTLDNAGFLPLRLIVSDSAPPNSTGTVTLFWSVNDDEVTGSKAFDYVVRTTKYMFGLDRFHVDNCRSKGDHNDVDTLIVAVSNDKQTLPTQQVLLGDNLHAGDEVSNRFVGPFEVQHGSLITVTFTVMNGADGAVVENTAKKILETVGDVLDVAGGLDELHFAGLDPSTIESAIIGGAGLVFTVVGAVIGHSNPDCSGAVAVHSFVFKPGELLTAPASVGPVPETQSSPSECGNSPRSTVTFAFRPA